MVIYDAVDAKPTTQTHMISAHFTVLICPVTKVLDLQSFQFVLFVHVQMQPRTEGADCSS